MKKHDQRLAPRFTITDGGAVLVFPNLIVSHSLLDISEKGLGFSYIANVRYENWIGKELEIDLFGENFVIVKIPARIIFDRPFGYSEMGESFNVNKPHLRRCGVQFSYLHIKQSQKHRINSYVDSLDILSTQEN